MTLESKLNRLYELIDEMGSVAVAYSGGVDSALLLKVAVDRLGNRAIALTAVSPSLPEAERTAAVNLALEIGAEIVLIDTHEVEDPRYLVNAPNRCYFCKSEVYDLLLGYAQERGISRIIDGANADDVGDHRPGQQAAREAGVRSPLLEAELKKEEIRTLAQRFNLPNWDKPAAACLSSRIPYGTRISIEMLSQVEQAEARLRELGFGQLRVRHHDQIARIELEPEEFTLAVQHRQAITTALKSLGYTYVTLDLSGFQSGSLNAALKKNGHRKTASAAG